ncbi:MAG TPA: hypothetical protein VHL58_03995 [Thermoanaerobaculia bacterium]|nr:hypothetical protein [Thermoanaerobaculia bacterium]
MQTWHGLVFTSLLTLAAGAVMEAQSPEVAVKRGGKLVISNVGSSANVTSSPSPPPPTYAGTSSSPLPEFAKPEYSDPITTPVVGSVRGDSSTTKLRFLSRGITHCLLKDARGNYFAVAGQEDDSAGPLQSHLVNIDRTTTPGLRVDRAQWGVPPHGVDPTGEKVNYFIGSDRARWLTGIPVFKRVLYPGVLPGIDVTYTTEELKDHYTIHVAAGRISGLKVSFGDSAVLQDGSVAAGASPRVHQPAPIIRQSGKSLDARYVKNGPDLLSVEADDYDSSREADIEIDAYRFVPSFTYDRSKKATLAGRNFQSAVSPDGRVFSISTGAVSDQTKGTTVVACFKEGKRIFTSYVGGGGTTAAATDKSGNVYITGNGGMEIPILDGVRSKSGGAFVTRLNSLGVVDFSSIILPDPKVKPDAITVKEDGDIAITGEAFKGFPTSSGFALRKGGDATDVFLAIISPGGGERALEYLSYIGGDNSDAPAGIASRGDLIYITGTTLSSNFPTSATAFQKRRGGGSRDAFIIAVDVSTKGPGGLIASTLLGGGSDEHGLLPDRSDAATALALDDGGNVVVAGSTTEADFPLSAEATHRKPLGGNDIFVAMLDPTLSHILYADRFGGSGDDVPVDMKMQQGGSVFILGRTMSPDFPRLHSSRPPEIDEEEHAFLLELNSLLSATVFSEFLGGADHTRGGATFALAVNRAGIAYITAGSLISSNPTGRPPGSTVSSETSAGLLEVTPCLECPSPPLITRVHKKLFANEFEIEGSGFTKESRVLADGKAATASFVDSGHLHVVTGQKPLHFSVLNSDEQSATWFFNHGGSSIKTTLGNLPSRHPFVLVAVLALVVFLAMRSRRGERA